MSHDLLSLFENEDISYVASSPRICPLVESVIEGAENYYPSGPPDEAKNSKRYAFMATALDHQYAKLSPKAHSAPDHAKQIGLQAIFQGKHAVTVSKRKDATDDVKHAAHEEAEALHHQAAVEFNKSGFPEIGNMHRELESLHHAWRKFYSAKKSQPHVPGNTTGARP
jgi:homoserine dehydrogenase